MAEWEIHPRVAVAAALAALREGLARQPRGREELYKDARAVIKSARASLEVLMSEGSIPPVPTALPTKGTSR